MKNIRYIKLLLTLAPLTGAIMPIIACNKPKVKENDTRELKVGQTKDYVKSLLIAREERIKPNALLEELFKREKLFSGKEKLKVDSLFDNEQIKDKFFNSENPDNFKDLPKTQDDQDFNNTKSLINVIINTVIANKDNPIAVLDKEKDRLAGLWDKIEGKDILKEYGPYIDAITKNVETLVEDMDGQKTYKQVIESRTLDIRNLFLEIFDRVDSNGELISNKQGAPEDIEQKKWVEYSGIVSNNSGIVGDNTKWVETIEKKWNENSFNQIKWSMKLSTLLVPIVISMIKSKDLNSETKKEFLGEKYEGFKSFNIADIKKDILKMLDTENIFTFETGILSTVELLTDETTFSKLINPMTFDLSKLGEKLKSIKSITPDKKGMIDAIPFKNLSVRALMTELIPLALNIITADKNIMEEISSWIKENIIDNINKYIPDSLLKDSELQNINLNTVLSELNDLLKKIKDQLPSISEDLKEVDSKDKFILAIYKILGVKDNKIEPNSILEKLQNIIKNKPSILKLINGIIQNIDKKISYDYWEKVFRKKLINFHEQEITDEESETEFNLEYKVIYNETNNFKFTWSINNDDFKITSFEEL